MGIITLKKSNHLFWLGRYIERVYTTLKYYIKGVDKMIDKNPNYYAEYYEKIGILDIYGSKEKFKKIYAFSEEDSNSIISNLNRAYDNAIVMRDYIGTETMAYVQLVIDDVKVAERGSSPITDLMLALDHILAFWGCVDDLIDDEVIRNIIKLGKGIERLDLYLSFEIKASEIEREYKRMKQYLSKSHIRNDVGVINSIDSMLNSHELNYNIVRNLIRNLILE